MVSSLNYSYNEITIKKSKMACIVKQNKGNGKVHLYHATNHHFPVLKRPRQTRLYLEVLDQERNELLPGSNSPSPSEATVKALVLPGIGYSGDNGLSRNSRVNRRLSYHCMTDLSRLPILEHERVAVLKMLAAESAEFTIRNPGFEPVIYELTTHRQIKCRKNTDENYHFNLNIHPAGGAIVALYPPAIGNTDIVCPSAV
jgi:hypothetical protein